MSRPTLSFHRGKLAAALARLSRLMRRSTFPAAYLFQGSTISVGNGESQAVFDYGDGLELEEAVVPASAIEPFLRGDKDDLIVFHRDSPTHMTLSCGAVKFRTPLLERHMVPISDFKVDNWFKVDGVGFAKAIKEAGVWCGSHNKHPDFNHLQIAPHEKALFLISTNRVGISVAKFPCDHTLTQEVFIHEAMADLIAGASGEIELAFSDRRVSFRELGFTAHHNLFSDHKGMPLSWLARFDGVPKAAVVDRERLVEVLAGANSAANSITPLAPGVDISVTKEGIRVTKDSPESSFEASLPAEFHLEATFKAAADQFLRALDSTDAKDIELHTDSDKATPIVLMPVGKEWPLSVLAKMAPKE